jgi:hypothetical protein
VRVPVEKPPYGKRTDARIQQHVLDLPGPREAVARCEVLDVNGGLVRKAELPQGDLEGAPLSVVRIEIDGNKNEVLLVRSELAVIEDLVVPRVVEVEILKLLQRRVLAA